MKVFVDTSGFYALLVSTERQHDTVKQTFERLLVDRAELHTTSYVLIESMALLQARVGLLAAESLEDVVLPLVSVTWVDQGLHTRGMVRLRRAARRRLSLVDCVSFEVMRQEGTSRAVTLDDHFREAGFSVLP